MCFQKIYRLKKKFRPAAAFKKSLQPFYRNISSKRAFLLSQWRIAPIGIDN